MARYVRFNSLSLKFCTEMARYVRFNSLSLKFCTEMARYVILVDRIINVIHTLVKITSHLAQKESRTGRLKHIHVCLIVSDYIWKFCTELQTKTVKSDIPGQSLVPIDEPFSVYFQFKMDGVWNWRQHVEEPNLLPPRLSNGWQSS
jgi:hypothetical protein